MKLHQKSKIRRILTFIIFVAPPSNALSITRSRTALPLRAAGKKSTQIRSCRHSYQTRQYCNLLTLSNSDRESIDQSTDITYAVNVTEKYDTLSNSSQTADGDEKIEEEIQQEQKAILLRIEQEKEELEVAVNEVKEAVVEVSQSAKNLGDAVIKKVPGITSKFLKLRISDAFRRVEMRTSVFIVCIFFPNTN